MEPDNEPVPSSPSAFADRSPRQQVLLGAEIGGFGGDAPTRHRIKDLSATGARVDRAGALRPGSTVLVSVGTLEAVGATVIWVRDDAAGLKFAETIDPDAARSRTIVSAGRAASTVAISRAPVPTAGWIGGLASPYRR